MAYYAQTLIYHYVNTYFAYMLMYHQMSISIDACGLVTDLAQPTVLMVSTTRTTFM